MLIVIGGDSYYKDENEEAQSVISRWARRKVASQFREEYLDGRQSFIFSWDKKTPNDSRGSNAAFSRSWQKRIQF